MTQYVHDPGLAERIVADAYIPNTLDLGGLRGPLAMELVSAHLGDLTAGRLSYGRPVKMTTSETEHFHINVPLRGVVASRSRSGNWVTLRPGQAGVFGAGPPSEMVWSGDCELLCLRVTRATAEAALERLLNEPIRDRLKMSFATDLTKGGGRAWWGALRMVLDDLSNPEAGVRSPAADRHVEAVVLDRMLLADQHNYTEALSRVSPACSSRMVRRVVDLIEDRPGDPWTIASLASEVHVSVRSLQQHFHDEIGTPPMTYLRDVRLKWVREMLEQSTSEAATVRTIATEAGFLHPGRFAVLYRDAHGESPSTTLRRPPPG